MSRFVKSIRVAKGLKLNFSNSGVSATIGTSGASVNVGTGGVSVNMSKLPKTLKSAVESREKARKQEELAEKGRLLEEKTEGYTDLVESAPRVMAAEDFAEAGASEAVLAGERRAIDDAFSAWLEGIGLPFEIEVDYDWDQASGTALLDLDLPEIEDIPVQYLSRTESGTVSMKDKTLKRRREEYVSCVCGLAIWCAASVMNFSPRVETVVVSGYTQRRDKAGDLADEYVLSVRFDRAGLRRRPFHIDEPLETVLAFENRINLATSGNMKKIEPFES
jgi:hypothetical protein